MAHVEKTAVRKKTIGIYDCLGKEKLIIKRLGGDLALKFVEVSTGKTIFEAWFELKKPAKKNFERIIAQFEEIKKRLIQRVSSVGQ